MADFVLEGLCPGEGIPKWRRFIQDLNFCPIPIVKILSICLNRTFFISARSMLIGESAQCNHYRGYFIKLIEGDVNSVLTTNQMINPHLTPVPIVQFSSNELLLKYLAVQYINGASIEITGYTGI